jgi:hypothetical protein
LWALSAAGIELDAELAGAVATLAGFITAYFARDRVPAVAKTPARRR